MTNLFHVSYLLAYNSYLLLQAFFEDLNPYGEMSEKEINDILYDGSLLIEPRGAKQTPKFVRNWFLSFHFKFAWDYCLVMILLFLKLLDIEENFLEFNVKLVIKL